MAVHSNDDRRDGGDDWPDEDIHLAAVLLQEDGEFSPCFDL